MYPQHLDELFVYTVQTFHLDTDQVQLPKEDAIANQHQHNDEDKAQCQAAMDVDAVEEWNVRQRMPQPSRKSSRAVGVSHALSSLEFPRTSLPSNGLHVTSLANRFRSLILVISNPARRSRLESGDPN